MTRQEIEEAIHQTDSLQLGVKSYTITHIIDLFEDNRTLSFPSSLFSFLL